MCVCKFVCDSARECAPVRTLEGQFLVSGISIGLHPILETGVTLIVVLTSRLDWLALKLLDLLASATLALELLTLNELLCG